MKLLFVFLLSFSAIAADPVRAKHGMVVSSHSLASEVGLEVLRSGGNAVDAAIATGLALAVVHPSAGNIGGGGFMLIMLKNGGVTSFDFRETAPLAASPEMFAKLDNSNHEGYKSIGVPGTIAGFDAALKGSGSKPLKELIAPAIKLADEGFALSDAQAVAFAKLKADWKKYPSSAKVFLHPDGSAYQAGEIWKQPDLAKTMRIIQASGRDGFYKGRVAQQIAADMRAHGGLITERDLAEYHAVERRPIRGRYHEYEIYSMAPPSSGGIALVEMLNILEPYNLASLSHNSAPYIHLLSETMRRAFADRAKYIGDPNFADWLPMTNLLSKEHAKMLRATIDEKRASPSDPAKFGDIYESPETTHYSVIDAAGNAVVVTYTLEYSYGSRIVTDGLGFLYNNEMGDFNPKPGRTDETGLIGTDPNTVAPTKRMLSSMSPTIVAKYSEPVLLIGSPGGRTIINTVLETTLNVLDHKMNIADAIAAPRFHHQWLPNQIQIESGKFSSEVTNRLQQIGHKISEVDRIGEAMGITVDPITKERLGAADPRSPDGKAVGY
jgi:gamma-glutamyltranspeptidase/glutathione hydrolase